MDWLELLVANLGLTVFTLVAVGLSIYLTYVMFRPEAV
jgi:K+-transporting ATPase KdpF subunit